MFTFSFIGEETQQESYKYLTVDEMKSLGDDSMPIDVTHDEGMKKSMERSQDYSNQVSIQLFFNWKKEKIIQKTSKQL